jgi:uncharacterized protein (DUF488 family)
MSYSRILTIGHSNHSLEHFLSLLRCHSVQVIADVRSHPYSTYASVFDQEALTKSLGAAGFQYVYLGNELGGRPHGNAYYDTDGRVLYGKVAESSAFQAGLARLENGLRQSVVAALCAEEDPAGCHRRLLVGRVLTRRGVLVEHIRGDGRLQTEEQLEAAQLSLFDGMETSAWKSIPSVSLKRRQSSSSAF